MIRRAAFLIFLALVSLSAQAFTLVDSKGKAHSLAQYKGKWVLVNFWATWCPPCLEEIPDLVALHENKKNNLVVLGVAMDYRDAKTVLQFSDQMMVSYPIILVVAYNVGVITREAVERYIHAKK
jgi:thiol-disulfide isomerase/thioredoxin